MIVSLGLSACTGPILNRSGEDIAPSPLPDMGQPIETSPNQPLLVVPSDTPAELSVTSEVSQFQAAPATNRAYAPFISHSEAVFPYRLQAGTPRTLANFILPESGCNWMGVGGQAFNLRGQPVSYLVVEVGGTLAGSDVFHLELTGNQTNLGVGGYLITLSNRPVASSGSLWILLYDLGGQPLTNKIYFNTVQDCTQNFILINFVEVNPNLVPEVYLPIIIR
jgi:hypothetical protein